MTFEKMSEKGLSTVINKDGDKGLSPPFTQRPNQRLRQAGRLAWRWLRLWGGLRLGLGLGLGLWSGLLLRPWGEGLGCLLRQGRPDARLGGGW